MTTVPELDPVIHAQARLRVVATLSALPEGDRIGFPRLQEILRMTAGNLSVHLRKLEDAGYVEITKTHHGRTPATLVCLSRRGRLAFDDYTAAVRALLARTEPPQEIGRSGPGQDLGRSGPGRKRARSEPARGLAEPAQTQEDA